MADRLKDIKNMVEAMDGEFTAQLFGYEMNEKTLIEDYKWLIEQAEKLEALGNFKEEPSHKYDTLPVAIDKVLKDETIDDKTKLERIDAYVDVWYGWQEVRESDYM